MTATASLRRLGKALTASALLGAAFLLPAGSAAADGDLCPPPCGSVAYYSSSGELVGAYYTDADGTCDGWGTSGPVALWGGPLCVSIEPIEP
ncbi:MAG TPA: hypothetical protein VHN15_02615 [Thermoanaerobaculia bacterium]|nr:hypothetical protein [Thermoanaerobaculia bacterium]